MKKFACYATIVGSKFVGIVEAETEEEAKDKAWDLDETYVSFCHQCSGQCENPEITEIEVEEEE